MTSRPRGGERAARRWICGLALATAAVAGLRPGGNAGAQPAGAEAAAADAQQEERALVVARRMAAVLAGAQALRLAIDFGYDAVQADGQAIEFGATRSVALRRPDRVRMDVEDRAGGRRLLVYDGRAIGFSDASQGVYATAAFSGDLDGMLAYVQGDLGLPTPLAEFISRDLYEGLASSSSARWIGEQTLAGVRCDHLAFRNPEKGLQIWVPQEGAPLPRRIVITYESERGRPQFRADLRDWELSPELPDSLFEFRPDPGAERIHFRSGARVIPGVPSKEKSQ
jgi:hypothetical protein